MKKTLTALAIVAIFAACSSKNKTGAENENIVTKADTMTIDHNSFTDKGAVINMNGVSDTIVSSDGSHYVKVNPNSPVAPVPEPKPASHTTRTYASGTSTHTSTASSASAGPSVSPAGTGTASSTPVVAKKAGWSNTLKGAVIGAGTGAVAGALIDKKKGQGAIIGGLLGAGGGFVVGKVLDKKAAKTQ